MKTQQLIIIERRQRAREGVFAEIENITYNVLRRYGINGPSRATQPQQHAGESRVTEPPALA